VLLAVQDDVEGGHFVGLQIHDLGVKLVIGVVHRHADDGVGLSTVDGRYSVPVHHAVREGGGTLPSVLEKAGVSQRAMETDLGMQLRELVPGLDTVRRSGPSGRQRCWVLPPLADCRKKFEAVV
jgi:hypothetical protein